MLSSLLRPKKDPRRRELSPLASPYYGVVPSPVSTRRNVAAERRRVAADFDTAASSELDDEYGDLDGAKGDEEEEDEEVEEEEEEEEELQEEEDEHEETSPLLPIFEAAHLGRFLCLKSSAIVLTKWHC